MRLSKVYLYVEGVTQEDPFIEAFVQFSRYKKFIKDSTKKRIVSELMDNVKHCCIMLSRTQVEKKEYSRDASVKLLLLIASS